MRKGKQMIKDIIGQFDRYDEIMKEIEVSRKYGIDYSNEDASPEQYINLLHPSRIKYKVLDIIEETSTAKTLRLVSQDNYLPPFQAGQYIALYLEIDKVRTSRPYSISSSPSRIGYYDITIRRVDNGLVSNYLLDEMNRGDALESSGPSGDFFYNPLFHDPTMVCLAGGSGVTPFMSMIREVVDRGLDRTIILFYGAKNLDEAIFHDELQAVSRRFDNIHYIPVLENTPDGFDGARGLITDDLIREKLGDPENKTFYVCGPQGMYDFCMPALDRMSIPRRKIRNEAYGVPMNISSDPGWPREIKVDDTFRVSVKGAGSFDAKAGVPLLVTLENNGVLTPSVCRSGECSMCRVKLLSGKVFQPAGVLVRKSDRKYGYIHSCAAYPLEDVEILV